MQHTRQQKDTEDEMDEPVLAGRVVHTAVSSGKGHDAHKPHPPHKPNAKNTLTHTQRSKHNHHRYECRGIQHGYSNETPHHDDRKSYVHGGVDDGAPVEVRHGCGTGAKRLLLGSRG